MDLSVIIPIYNVEEYLLECLDSVWHNVEHLRAEVILVDDGSTDGSSTIARTFAREHKQFVYFRVKNGGSSAARNFGIGKARGKRLFFMDADDVLVENTLPVMLHAAKAHHAQIVTCEVSRLQPDSRITLSTLQMTAFGTAANNVTNVREHPQLVNDCTVSNKLIDTRFYRASGISFPEGRLYEDYRVMVPLYCMAKTVVIIRNIGYLWRVRSSDILSNSQRLTDLKNAQDKVQTIDELFDFFDAHSIDDAIRRQIELKVARLDFNGYIANLKHMKPTQAQEFVELMAAAIERHVSPQTLEQTPLKTRQTMRYLMDRDVEGLIAWDEYLHNGYATAAFKREGDALLFDSPCDLLTIDSRDVLPDVRVANPLSYVDDVQKDGDVYTIKGHLYTPRVSIANPAEQTVRAYLVNDLWGTKIPLPCTSCVCEHLTASRGTIVSTDGSTHTYNYDGTGFELVLDLAALHRQQRIDGNNAILLEYENWVKHDYRILRGAGKRAQYQATKAKCQRGQYKSAIVWDQRNTLFVCVEHVPIHTRLRRKAGALKRRLLNNSPQ